MSRASSIIRGFDREVLGHEVGQQLLQALGLDLGQEADAARVHAEHGHVDLGQRPRGAQERAVAAQHDQAVGAGSCSTSSSVASDSAAQLSMPWSRHQAIARSRSSIAAGLVGLKAKPMRVIG